MNHALSNVAEAASPWKVFVRNFLILIFVFIFAGLNIMNTAGQMSDKRRCFKSLPAELAAAV